jgi:hypothetical protein
MTKGRPPSPPFTAEHPSAPSPEPSEVAAYIANHCQALHEIARRSQLDFLAYLVDMARLEAVEQARAAPQRTFPRVPEA